MNDEFPRRSVLILSTTPPIPRDYGNRNRVFQTLAFFRRLNFAVSFLLYPLAEIGRPQFLPTTTSWPTASISFPSFRTADRCISRRAITITRSTNGGMTTSANISAGFSRGAVSMCFW
jgi:hypothetical protein